MHAHYYGFLIGFAASVSLALAGCSDKPPSAGSAALPGAAPARVAAQNADSDPDITDENLWSVLGLAKRPSERQIGPQTGASVSPELWQAALDALQFAGISSEDPLTGLLVTKWYSPPSQPNEQLRVSIFILSRALRSDSLAVTVERQERSPTGQWSDTPVAKDVVAGLESAVLQRARQIHAERYRSSRYN